MLLEDIIRNDAPKYLETLKAEQEQALASLVTKRYAHNGAGSSSSGGGGRGGSSSGGGGRTDDKYSRLHASLEGGLNPYEIGKTKVLSSSFLCFFVSLFHLPHDIP